MVLPLNSRRFVKALCADNALSLKELNGEVMRAAQRSKINTVCDISQDKFAQSGEIGDGSQVSNVLAAFDFQAPKPF